MRTRPAHRRRQGHRHDRHATSRPTPRPLPCLALVLTLSALSALLGLAVPAVGAGRRDVAAGEAEAVGAGVEVAQLLAQAASADERYAAGWRAARARQARAAQLERLLARKRAELAVMHRDVGRVARAQYRTGGRVPGLVRLLLARTPDDLLPGQQLVRGTGRPLTTAVVSGRRAERRLAADEKKAVGAARRLDQDTDRLAAARQDIEDRLEAARGRLQGEAEESVAAGRCPPAVPLQQPVQATADRTGTGAARQDEAPPAAWVLPVDHYQLSAGYDNEGAHWAHRHTGQDFAVDIGTPVRAVGAGRVVSVECSGPFGIHIVLRHPDGFSTQYAHLSAPAVAQGDEVDTGQWIGQSGSTGNSTGPHLHFEVRTGTDTASAIDPVAWLTERGIAP